MTQIDFMLFSNPRRTIVCWAVILTSVVLNSNHALAQGKLSRLRAAVQPPEQAKQENHKPDRSAQRDQQGDRGHRRNHKRGKRKRRDSYGLAFAGFLSDCVSACSLESVPVVVEYQPAVSFQQPRLAYSDYSPVVSNQAFLTSVAPSSVDQALSGQVISEAALGGALGEDQIGQDWFTSWFMRGNAVAGGGSDDMTLAGVSLLAQIPGAIGLDLGVKTWRENSSAYRDHLWIGDANVVYEFANHQYFRARMGVGINWLSDQLGADSGLNLTAGVDVRLTERWVLAVEGDVGTLGAADFLHSQISLARRFDKSELVLGYDYYDVGGVDLQGIFGGLQFRF